MILFKNTDNGRVFQIPENEAFIYDRASNFVRVLAEVPLSRPRPAVPNIPRRTTKKKV